MNLDAILILIKSGAFLAGILWDIPKQNIQVDPFKNSKPEQFPEKLKINGN